MAAPAPAKTPTPSYEQKKKSDAEARRRRRENDSRERRISELEARIAEREQKIRDLETAMSAAGFYDDRGKADAVVSQHRDLMWEVGDLMNQWEALQTQETVE